LEFTWEYSVFDTGVQEFSSLVPIAHIICQNTFCVGYLDIKAYRRCLGLLVANEDIEACGELLVVRSDDY